MEVILKENDRRHHRIAFDEDDYIKVFDGSVQTGEYAQVIKEDLDKDDTYVNMYEWYVEAEALEPFNFYADFMLTYGGVAQDDTLTVEDQNAVTLALIPEGTTIKEGFNAGYYQKHPGGLKFRDRLLQYNAVVVEYVKDHIDGTTALPEDVQNLATKGETLEARVFYKLSTDYLMIKTIGLDCLVLVGKFQKDNLVKLRIFKKALTDDGVAV